MNRQILSIEERNETVMDNRTQSIAKSLQTGELSDSASLNLSILLESHIRLGSGANNVRESARDIAESVLVSLDWRIEEGFKPPDLLEAEAITQDILDDLTILKTSMQQRPQQQSYPSNKFGFRVFAMLHKLQTATAKQVSFYAICADVLAAAVEAWFEFEDTELVDEILQRGPLEHLWFSFLSGICHVYYMH